MNTKYPTHRWKRKLLLLALLLVTGAGAVHVSKLNDKQPADKQKTAKKGGEKQVADKHANTKPDAKKDGGGAGGGGGGDVMVADASGPGHAIGSQSGGRGDRARDGAPQGAFDDRVFDMEGGNAPGAGAPGGTDSKQPGSFEKGVGGGFDGGKQGGGGDGGTDPKGGPGAPGSSGGPNNFPTFAGTGPGSGGGDPGASAPIASPVPEPETYLMLVMGLGVVGWVAKRRGKRSN